VAEWAAFLYAPRIRFRCPPFSSPLPASLDRLKGGSAFWLAGYHGAPRERKGLRPSASECYHLQQKNPAQEVTPWLNS